MRNLPSILLTGALVLAVAGCASTSAPPQPRERAEPPPPNMETRAREQSPGPVFRLKGPSPAQVDAPEDAAAAGAKKEDGESGRE